MRSPEVVMVYRVSQLRMGCMGESGRGGELNVVAGIHFRSVVGVTRNDAFDIAVCIQKGR